MMRKIQWFIGNVIDQAYLTFKGRIELQVGRKNNAKPGKLVK